MNTNNIYFADASIIIEKKRLDSYSVSFFYEIPLYDYKVYYRDLKKVLVLYSEDKYGNNFVIDLNTKEKLGFKVPSNIGKVFINPNSFVPFNVLSGNKKNNLTKRKILKIGNPILNELNKEE